MSASLSIFQKLCPSCATSVPVGTALCECGHVFVADGADSGPSTEESLLRDEELYESYLAARAVQAQEAARAAVDIHAEEPDNADKHAAAELAKEVAKSLEADLREQRAKLQRLRGEMQPATAKPPVIVQKPAAKPVSAKPAPIRTRAVAEPAAPVLKSTPALTQKPVALQQTTSTASKVAGAFEAIKSAKARETAARAKRAPQPAPKAAAPAPQKTPVQPPRSQTAHPSTVAITPPPAFRAEQAAKAEKALEVRRKTDGKDCPNCTANVPLTTTRCGCGFTFASGGNDLPSLTLCTGDFSALRNEFLKSLRPN
jgi:hypothetical protein